MFPWTTYKLSDKSNQTLSLHVVIHLLHNWGNKEQVSKGMFLFLDFLMKTYCLKRKYLSFEMLVFSESVGAFSLILSKPGSSF